MGHSLESYSQLGRRRNEVSHKVLLPTFLSRKVGAVQIGRNLPLCGTFGYIDWKLGDSAPGKAQSPEIARRS